MVIALREQDIIAHINLIDQLSAEVHQYTMTATISDSLTAKVEVTYNGSKVIVNVPVKVVEKELSVVKQQAIESIKMPAQQKINEINNRVDINTGTKEAAIAEDSDKLKQQAIDHVNNAPDVHSVEEIQQQEQAHLNNLIQNNLRLNKQNQIQLNRLKMQFNI